MLLAKLVIIIELAFVVWANCPCGPSVPIMSFYSGFINLHSWDTPYYGSCQPGQPYTLELLMDNIDRYDFVIDQCTYGRGLSFIDKYGCLRQNSKFFVKWESKQQRYGTFIKRVLVYFYADYYPLIEINCQVRVLRCASCAEKACERRPYLHQYQSWSFTITPNLNPSITSNCPCNNNNCKDNCNCNECARAPISCDCKSPCGNNCQPELLPFSPDIPLLDPAPLQPNDVVTISPCSSTDCVEPIPTSCANYCQPLITAPMSIPCDCPFGQFGCAISCIRCDTCAPGVYYSWWSLTPWWIWLLLLLIPLLLLCCCCIPWLAYIFNHLLRRNKHQKTITTSTTVAPSSAAVIPYHYERAPQRIICADKDVQTNIIEVPRTTAVRSSLTTEQDVRLQSGASDEKVNKNNKNRETYSKQLSDLQIETINHVSKSTDRKKLGVQHITSSDNEDYRIVTRIPVEEDKRQYDAYDNYYIKSEMNKRTEIPLYSTQMNNGNSDIYLSNENSSIKYKINRLPLTQHDEINIPKKYYLTRKSIPYSDRWEAYDSEEIKESIIDTISSPTNANQKVTEYENYRPANADIRINEYDTERQLWRNYEPTSSSSKSRYSDAPTARHDYSVERRMSPAYGNTVPSNEEYIREEFIHTTRQSSAI